MKPVSPQRSDENALREQLILAQVRIMELEDERDETAARMKVTEGLLRDAQTIADRTPAEAESRHEAGIALQATIDHLLAQRGATVAEHDRLTVQAMDQGGNSRAA